MDRRPGRQGGVRHRKFYSGLIEALAAFAEFEFELAAPIEEGEGTLIDHLRVIERRTGVKPQMLVDAPKLPPSCIDVWNNFGELHSCRGSSGFGPNRIGFVDIDAFQRVTGVRMAPWELQAIKRLDRVYLAHWNAHQPKRES